MIFLLVMYPAAWADVAINATNFPDEVFRAYVRTYFDKDYNMVLSDEEIAGATRINVYNVSDISSLKGIEYFTALTVLDCSHTQLTRLDVSKNVVLTTLIYGSQGREGLLITSSGNASCPYQLDFSVYMSSDKFASVSNVKGFASNDASITATYSNGVAMFATRPVKVTYNYATGYGSKTMGVTISGDASSEPTPTPPPTSTPPPFGTSYYYNSGNDGNTWETAYILSSAADFLLLQERVSNGTEGTGKYYKLNANVDMTSVTGWYGIGRDNDPSKSEEEIIHPFTGHFDGQNHTVYANPDLALFGAVRTENDTIAVRNINLYGYTHYSPLAFALMSGIIENCNFSGTVETSGIPDSSGLISFVFGGTVRNCTVTAEISAVSGSAGGIAAFLSGGTITGCTIASGSKINASERTGTSGSVRVADDENSTGYAGGIVGVADSGTISYCTIDEDVEITASHNAGCIAGKILLNCNLSGNSWPSMYYESGTGGSVNSVSNSSGCNAGFGGMGGGVLILSVSFIAARRQRKKC